MRKMNKKGQRGRSAGNPMIWVLAVLVLFAIVCGLSQCEPEQSYPGPKTGLQVNPDVGLRLNNADDGPEYLTAADASDAIMVFWDVSSPIKRDFSEARSKVLERLNDDILTPAKATGKQTHWLVGRGVEEAVDLKRNVQNPRPGLATDTFLLEAGYKIGEALGKGDAGTFIVVSDLCTDAQSTPKIDTAFGERICTSKEAVLLGRKNPGLPPLTKRDGGRMFGPCIEQGVLDGHGLASDDDKALNKAAKTFGGLEHLTVDLLQFDSKSAFRTDATCNTGQHLYMMVLSVKDDLGKRVAAKAADQLKDVGFKRVSLIDTLPTKHVETSCRWSPDDPGQPGASTWPEYRPGSNGPAIDCRDVAADRKSRFSCLQQRPPALGLVASKPNVGFDEDGSTITMDAAGLGVDVDGGSRGETPGDWTAERDQLCTHPSPDDPEPLCDLLTIEAGCGPEASAQGQDKTLDVTLDYDWQPSTRPIAEIKEFNRNHRNVNNLFESLVVSGADLVAPRKSNWSLTVMPSQ